MLTFALVACGHKPQAPMLPVSSPSAPTSTKISVNRPAKPIYPTDMPNPEIAPVIIASVTVDGSGHEVVVVTNISSVPQDIGNYSLYNPRLKRHFDFPKGLVLAPGESIEVHSGPGASHIKAGFFWTEERLWTQRNEDVLLLNPAGRVVFWYIFPGP